MSGKISDDLRIADEAIKRAVGKALKIRDPRSPNGRLRMGVIRDQRHLVSALLKVQYLRNNYELMGG